MSLGLTGAEWSALRLSITVACGCVLVSAIPGIALGWLLARKRFPGHGALNALLHLPLVLPPVAVGYALLLLLGRNGALRGFVPDLAFSWWAAVIASAVMGFPLLVRSVRLGVELVEPRLEEAARTLGASPFRIFRTVTLPLSLPGVITGLVLAFARSLGEFGATITFAGNIFDETRTIPLALFNAIQTPGGEAVAGRLLGLSIALSLIALLVSEWIAARVRRRIGRSS